MHWNRGVVKALFNLTLIPSQPSAVAKHFVALSTNGVSGHALSSHNIREYLEKVPLLYLVCLYGMLNSGLIVYYYILLQPKVKDFGIDTDNMFEFWDVSVHSR